MIAIIITIAAVIAAIIFVSIGAYSYYLLKEEKKRTDRMIEITPMLQNAVLQAFDYAKRRGDEFQSQVYKKLYEAYLNLEEFYLKFNKDG